MMSVRSRKLHGGFASSTSISSTTAARSVGGLGHVAVCCNGVPSGGNGSAPYQFWHCFEKRTLWRGSSHDCFKHRVHGRSFSSHLCLTLQRHTRVTFSGERKGLPCNTISLSETETDDGPTSHTHKKNRNKPGHIHLTPLLTFIARQLHHFHLHTVPKPSLSHSYLREIHSNRVYEPQPPFFFSSSKSHFYTLLLGLPSSNFSLSSAFPSTPFLNQLL